MIEKVHQDYIDGYIDGRDMDSPEPNENRSLRYKHSFCIGRAEVTNTEPPFKNYASCMKRIEEIERIEK